MARLRRTSTPEVLLADAIVGGGSAGQLDAHIHAAREHMHRFLEQGVGSGGGGGGGGNGSTPARRPSPPPSGSASGRPPSPATGGGGSRAGVDAAAADAASRLEIIELQPLSKGQRGRAPRSTCPST